MTKMHLYDELIKTRFVTECQARHLVVRNCNDDDEDLSCLQVLCLTVIIVVPYHHHQDR